MLQVDRPKSRVNMRLVCSQMVNAGGMGETHVIPQVNEEFYYIIRMTTSSALDVYLYV